MGRTRGERQRLSRSAETDVPGTWNASVRFVFRSDEKRGYPAFSRRTYTSNFAVRRHRSNAGLIELRVMPRPLIDRLPPEGGRCS